MLYEEGARHSSGWYPVEVNNWRVTRAQKPIPERCCWYGWQTSKSLRSPPIDRCLTDAVSEAAWKVVIHRENPGVQTLPLGLHTFQTASYNLVLPMWPQTALAFHVVKIKLRAAGIPREPGSHTKA